MDQARQFPIEAYPGYLPECSNYDSQDFWNKFESRGLAFNLSNAGEYVYDQVVPSLVPGMVLGALCLLGFLAFTAWACVSCCCACFALCCKCARRPAPTPDAQQFLTAGSGTADASVAYPGPGVGEGKRGCCPSWKKWFWALFILTGLATVGVAIWGLVESCKLTSHTVSDFWDIVAGVQTRAQSTVNALQSLETTSAKLASSSEVLAANQDQVTQALVSQANMSQQAAAATTRVLVGAAGALGQAAPALQGAIGFLNESVLGTINTLQADYEPPTMAVQETWRFLPIAIVFGLLILLVIATMIAVWFMTWPKTAALLVALLWLAIALLMLLGTGLLNGVYVVSDDACLYTETFVIDYAKRRTANTRYGGAVVGMIKYYTANNDTAAGSSALFPYLPADNNTAISAADTEVLQELEKSGGAVDQLRGLNDNPVILQVLGASAGAALEAASAAVSELKDEAASLKELSAWQSVRDLYWQSKDYVCCTLKSNMHDMWVAWTITGCLGFVLALMASGRLIYMARQRRKAWKLSQQEAPGAAVLWSEPPKPSAYSPPEQNII